MTPHRVTALPFLTAALFVGCGKSESKDAMVKGKLVTAGGAPFRVQRPIDKPLPPGDPGVQVKFTSLEAAEGEGRQQPFFSAAVDPDTGTFEVPGPSGKGVPPGKYRVTVYTGAVGEGADQPPTGQAGNEDDTGLDGTEVARTEVTVPPDGLTDLTIEVRVKKKR